MTIYNQIFTRILRLSAAHSIPHCAQNCAYLVGP
jgi:hypothetical protein